MGSKPDMSAIPPDLERWQSAAAELGIDIEAHRSSPFTSELAGWADLVITIAHELEQLVDELLRGLLGERESAAADS